MRASTRTRGTHVRGVARAFDGDRRSLVEEVEVVRIRVLFLGRYVTVSCCRSVFCAVEESPALVVVSVFLIGSFLIFILS